MAGMMQAITFTMVVLALFSSVIAVSPIQTFEGLCLDADSREYNLCHHVVHSREECKHMLLTSSPAVCAHYSSGPTPQTFDCFLGYTADSVGDGFCGGHLILRGSAHGYAVGGTGSEDAHTTCYAKSAIQSFDVTHERNEELLVFQEDSSRAVMYNVLTGAMWVSAAIAMTIGGVFVMRLRSLSMRGGGLVTAEPLLG